MRQTQGGLEIRTRGKGLTDITERVDAWLAEQNVRTGLLTIFITHTSASLTIQENADPDVRTDLEWFFERLVPEDNSHYRHIAEGPDDMPAHIRSALTEVQLTIPVTKGSLNLGTWQGIYVFEHRERGHVRKIVLHFIGE